MKQRDVDSSLKITDLENMFTIHEDNNGFFKYNLNETVYFNGGDSNYDYYTLKTDAFWTLVSYKIYGTTRLAWLLMKINGVKGRNMFDKLTAGQVIKYLPKETVNEIVHNINQ